jgi:two-component system, OmpR family, response regulator
MVRWPDERDRLAGLRGTATPRLLFVGAESMPPAPGDCLEDWVRVPVDERELQLRVTALIARAERHGHRPEIDGDGLLRFGSRWTDLPPVEHALAVALVDRFRAVVGREALARAAWPKPGPSRNALDVHISRLRRRIEPLGLVVRTVRSRGYLLQTRADEVDGRSPRTPT